MMTVILYSFNLQPSSDATAPLIQRKTSTWSLDAFSWQASERKHYFSTSVWNPVGRHLRVHWYVQGRYSAAEVVPTGSV